MNRIIKKGLLLGFTAGLIATLFDCLFMLAPRTSFMPEQSISFPVGYPFDLLIFNSLFWMIVGGISGGGVWVFVRKRKDYPLKENFFWVIFFLLPFVLTYGLLGKICFWPPNISLSQSFDHHLSFLWALFLLIFLAIYYKKKPTIDNSIQNLFILEITTFILIFQICSNLNKIYLIDFIYNIILKVTSLVQIGLNMEVFFYILILVIICLSYIIFFTKIKKYTYKTSHIIIPIFFIVLITTSTAAKINHNNLTRRNYQSSADIQSFYTKKYPMSFLLFWIRFVLTAFLFTVLTRLQKTWKHSLGMLLCLKTVLLRPHGPFLHTPLFLQGYTRLNTGLITL